MVTVCAWCGKVLKVTTDHPDLTSHGICEKCAAAVKLEKREAKRA
jgi:hypothetical protein